MPAVSETIVREFFELHGFFVRQQKKYLSPSRREDDEADFLVMRPAGKTPASPLPFVLSSEDMGGIEKAIVSVKGWHTDIFYVGLMTRAADLFRFANNSAMQQATRSFGEGPLLKILVIPGLPEAEELRNQSIRFMQEKGVDGVLSFRTLLQDLIAQTETNRNYQKSDLLQTIRILKLYDFFKDMQMELFKPLRRRKSPKAG